MQNHPSADAAAHGLSPWHGTTILLIRKGPDVVLAGDGQVTVGAKPGHTRSGRRVYEAGR